jgi:hypothetical protein
LCILPLEIFFPTSVLPSQTLRQNPNALEFIHHQERLGHRPPVRPALVVNELH